MAQQTALDFFLMKMVDLEIGKTFYPNQHQDLQDAYKEAKHMEFMQIVKAYHRGLFGGMESEKPIVLADEYYKETYNK